MHVRGIGTVCVVCEFRNHDHSCLVGSASGIGCLLCTTSRTAHALVVAEMLYIARAVVAN